MPAFRVSIAAAEKGAAGGVATLNSAGNLAEVFDFTPGSYESLNPTHNPWVYPACTHATHALDTTGFASLAIKIGFVPLVFRKARTVTTMAVNVTVAGAAGKTMRLGLYEMNPANGHLTLLVDAGDVALDSTGVKEVTGLSVAVEPQRIFLAAHFVRPYNDVTGLPTMTCPNAWRDMSVFAGEVAFAVADRSIQSGDAYSGATMPATLTGPAAGPFFATGGNGRSVVVAVK